jgi:hypothetical protein
LLEGEKRKKIARISKEPTASIGISIGIGKAFSVHFRKIPIDNRHSLA